MAYPPMPAILALGPMAIFGKSFPQQYLAHILGAGISLLTAELAWVTSKNIKLAVWAGILGGIGTITWFLSATGSSWYLGQLTACFFLLAALVANYKKAHPLLIGVLLGAAYMARVHTIISLPFFLFSDGSKIKIKNMLYLGLGILPFFLANSAYNFVRFGAIWDKGYSLIPGLFSEPWFSKGLVNLSYIPNHLRILFAELPKFSNVPPYVQPSWAGLAIWITTPAFIYAFLAPLATRMAKLAWISIASIGLIVFSHGSTGFAQFGYRFAVDFYPFLFLLTILGVSRKGSPSKVAWLLLAIGIIVNFWGVVWINKFGWVGY